MSINPLNHYSLTNPASVYDEESLTALELAARCAGKVNEVVKAVNDHHESVAKEQTAQNNRMAAIERHQRDTIPESIAAWLATHPETKFEQYVTPQFYGAVGDGNADDTVAIQKAMLFGRHVIIPKGRYKISGNIMISAGVTVEGAGYETIIESEQGLNVFLTLEGGTAAIRNLYIKHVGIDTLGDNIVVENIVSQQADGTAFFVRCDEEYPSTNITFRNCRANRSSGHGFNISSNRHVSENSRIDAVVDNILYENCWAWNSGDANESGGWGCGFCIAATESHIGSVTYKNCHVQSPYESGFHIEFEVERRSIVYENCWVDNAGSRKTDPTYGCGFFLHPNHRFIGCRVKGCKFLTYLPADNELRFTPADFERFDIFCEDNGMNLKDVCSRGVSAFSLRWARALMGSTFSNKTTRPFFNPLYFHSKDKALGARIADGKLVFDTTLDSSKQNTVCLPVFGVRTGYKYICTVIGTPATFQEDPTFVKVYLCFFDDRMNTLSSFDAQGEWTDEDENVITVNAYDVPYNAAYAAVVINPAYATNSAAQTYNAPVISRVDVREIFVEDE